MVINSAEHAHRYSCKAIQVVWLQQGTGLAKGIVMMRPGIEGRELDRTNERQHPPFKQAHRSLGLLNQAPAELLDRCRVNP